MNRDDFDARFRRTQRGIRFVFWLIVCFWLAIAIGFGVVIYKAASLDWSGGIKPVVEQMWCGSPGCLK